VLVVLAQDNLGFAFAVDLEDVNAVSVGFAGESRKVFGGLQTKARDDCISDVGEPSDPRWLLQNEESPQDIWIASPHISRTPVKTRTAFPLECPLVLVLKRNQRAGNAEAKL
jgi:hypothetical protein